MLKNPFFDIFSKEIFKSFKKETLFNLFQVKFECCFNTKLERFGKFDKIQELIKNGKIQNGS